MDQDRPNESQFQYTALPSSTSIRLIELHASPARDIVFSLHIASIADPTLYDALSYTWGSPLSPCLDNQPEDPSAIHSATIPATCNGRQVMLRPSLRDAMQMLQIASFSSLGRSKQRYVWIDALCIDQTNLEERAEQVGLMRDIYQKAELVISWLGPEDETTREALEVIDRLSSISFIPESASEAMVRSDSYDIIEAADFLNPISYRSKLGIEPLTQNHWLAWLAFLHRPYFKRVWVLQEVTVAMSIIAVCGSRQFDWQKLCNAIFFLIHTNWYIMLNTEYFRSRIAENPPAIYDKMLSQNLDFGASATYLCQNRVGSVSSGKFYTLASLLRNHRHCEASDARDMIYALLGIARQEREPFSTHGHLMVPDYTVPAPVLYTKTTMIMIESFKDLRLLAQREARCRSQNGVKGLPSWVPDYSVPLTPSPLVQRSPNCNWCAAGNLNMKQNNRSACDVLLDAQGYYIGDIEAVSDDPTDNVDVMGLWRSICQVAQGVAPFYTLDPEPDITNISSIQTRIEVLWRTLVADTFNGQHPAPLECGNQFLAHISSMVLKTMWEYMGRSTQKESLKSKLIGRVHALLYRNFGRSINEKKIAPLINLFASEPAASRYGNSTFIRNVEEFGNHCEASEAAGCSLAEWARPFEDFRREVNISFGTRLLFRTDGGLLGIGPLELAVGDQVWVLIGANTPVVLRYENEQRRFLGETYVHGIMHGEALDLGLDLIDIVLN